MKTPEGTATNSAGKCKGPLQFLYVFVCVEVLQSSQPKGVMSSVVSLPYHTFTWQALSAKLLTSIVHILTPETDNCLS